MTSKKISQCKVQMLNTILTSKLGHDWTSKLRTNCHNFQMLYRCPELVTNQPNIYTIVSLTILGSGLNSSRANQSSTKTTSMWHSRSRQKLIHNLLNPGFVHTLHCGPSDMRDKVNIHVCLKISGAVNDISSVWGFLLYISSCVVS